MRKSWTQEEFFAWAEAQEGRYEFDGVQPVAMTGETNAHDIILHHLFKAFDRRFPDDGPCRIMGPDAGVATVHSTVRSPDGVITCSKQDLIARTVSGALVLFEIVSDSTAGTDRIVKVREYAAVPTVMRYILIESTLAGVTVHSRKKSDEIWSTGTLTLEDTLQLPELGIEIPVAELYRGVIGPAEAVPGGA